MDVNKIQSEVRISLKNGNLDEAILCLEKFIDSLTVQDTDFSDSLIAISQKNREILNADIRGIIKFEERTIERLKITNSIQKLVNEIPLLIQRNNEKTESLNIKQESIQSALGNASYASNAIAHLEYSQGQNIVEVRGKLLNVDHLLVLLVKEIREKEQKLSEIKFKTEEANKLKKEIDELNEKIEKQRDEYDKLKSKYEEIKKEKQKTNELGVQIEMLRAKLEGKDRELEILRESFVQSREIMEFQRKEIERYKDKYE